MKLLDKLTEEDMSRLVEIFQKENEHRQLIHNEDQKRRNMINKKYLALLNQQKRKSVRQSKKRAEETIHKEEINKAENLLNLL